MSELDPAFEKAAPSAPRSHFDAAQTKLPRSRLRPAAKSAALLVSAGAIALGSMFYLTPPAGEAVALVDRQASEHGKGHPGAPPPPRFVAALIATEDHRFYSPFDPGLDLFAVLRVGLDLISGRRGDLGGSTIEQQLAKMLYTPQARGFAVKLEQVLIGIKLRYTYSKARILEMYADVVYFGNGYYGLQNASCGYFGKEPADLTWGQAAMLAGVLNGPSIFNPRTHPADARRRQDHVFERLVAVGMLTGAQAKSALAQPLGLVARPEETIFSSCP